MKAMSSEHANDRGDKNLGNRDDDGNYELRSYQKKHLLEVALRVSSLKVLVRLKDFKKTALSQKKDFQKIALLP